MENLVHTNLFYTAIESINELSKQDHYRQKARSHRRFGVLITKNGIIDFYGTIHAKL